MRVNQLILEVGRMCNMNCSHCLRGDSQNVKMSYEDAIFLIDQFDEIGSITFSGGEPVLYADLIIKIIDYIIEYDKPVFGFYVASNGKEVSLELMCALARFYAYIDDLDMVCEGSCTFDVSNDHFHEPIDGSNISLLKAFSFFHLRGDIKEDYCIPEGRALENGYGLSNHRALMEAFDYDEWGENFEVEIMYMNAMGSLFPDCDFSYEHQDKFGAFNIRDVRGGKISLRGVVVTSSNEEAA